MGVAKIPKCHKTIICRIFNALIKKVVYFKWVQSIVGPAGYFNDPRNKET
jgi:hypothetical protein